MGAMTNEQKVQLLSEPTLVAVADYLTVDKRTGKNNGVDYYTLSALVGSSTLKFETDAETVGFLRSLKKYSRIYISFDEMTFHNSGQTVKRAQKVTVE